MASRKPAPKPRPRRVAEKPGNDQIAAKATRHGAHLRGAKRDDTGRIPPHKPTEQTRTLVTLGASCGMTYERLSRVLGIGEETLAKHYVKELAEAKDKVESELQGLLYGIAHNEKHRGQVTAILALLNNKFGWRQPVDVHLKGQRKVVVNLSYGEPPPPARDGK
jgi:hypothetical protein